MTYKNYDIKFSVNRCICDEIGDDLCPVCFPEESNLVYDPGCTHCYHRYGTIEMCCWCGQNRLIFDAAADHGPYAPVTGMDIAHGADETHHVIVDRQQKKS